MACGCQGAANKTYQVTIPGQGTRTVKGEANAIQLTKGISGATYRPV